MSGEDEFGCDEDQAHQIERWLRHYSRNQFGLYSPKPWPEAMAVSNCFNNSFELWEDHGYGGFIVIGKATRWYTPGLTELGLSLVFDHAWYVDEDGQAWEPTFQGFEEGKGWFWGTEWDETKAAQCWDFRADCPECHYGAEETWCQYTNEERGRRIKELFAHGPITRMVGDE